MTHRYRRPIAALSALSALAASLLLAATPAAAATTCTPVQILAFRGSGETALSTGYTGTTVKTSGWEGKTLSRALQSYATQSRGKTAPNPRIDEVPIVAVGPNQFGTGKGYPAVAVPKTADVGAVKKTLGDSARAGAVSTAEYIDKTVAAQTAAGCRSPKFVVLGYSQGAIAARWLTQLRPKNIALSEIFGDPLQFQSQTGNHGNGAGGNGFLRYVSTDDEKRTDNGYYSVSGPSKSAVCHTGDPICDYNWLLVGVLALVLHQDDEHYNYVLQATETAQEGQTISRTVADLLAAAERPKSAAGQLAPEPERNYTDDIDIAEWMTAETTVVNADSSAALLPPVTATPSSAAQTAAPSEPRTQSSSIGTSGPQGITVRNGQTLRLTAGSIPAGQQYGFRIAPATADGSWKLPALLTSGVATSTGGPQYVDVTIEGLEPGTYSGGVLTESFTHTPDIAITVVP
ncbi:cutinase family protein [Leifsonia virtsii]|uniref:Cutinase family protein n=1 Tax=Leifsonia virtsii TaxID=3035915 RepID=A0ABT8IRZ0_9MICO|nr:cutinase family protein [Leifsonia virtsii]MDN4595565.1 cutinase family protein [Leifsonia virtsii]